MTMGSLAGTIPVALELSGVRPPSILANIFTNQPRAFIGQAFNLPVYTAIVQFIAPSTNEMDPLGVTAYDRQGESQKMMAGYISSPRRHRPLVWLALPLLIPLGYQSGVTDGGIDDLLTRSAGIAVIGALIAYYLSGAWWLRMLAGVLFTAIGLIAQQVGSDANARAFNQCIEQAETVRQALADFHQTRGHFPAALEDLPMDLPCTPWFGSTLLRYTETHTGYHLSFGTFITHSASENEAFSAHK